MSRLNSIYDNTIRSITKKVNGLWQDLYTNKTKEVLVSDDILLIKDSEDNLKYKQVSLSQITDGLSGGGDGDVSKVGTPEDDQVARWTGDGTLEGTSNFNFYGTNGAISTSAIDIANTGTVFGNGIIQILYEARSLVNFNGKQADGGIISHYLDTSSAITNVLAKLFAIRNDSVEKFSVDAYGNIDIEAGAEYRIDGVNIFDKYVKVEVSSAEILALNTTPKVLVVAPGAGKALVFSKAILSYNHVGTAYAATSQVKIINGTTLDQQWISNSILNKVANYIAVYDLNSDFGLMQENESLVLSAPVNPTTGDGTLTVHLWYKEIIL